MQARSRIALMFASALLLAVMGMDASARGAGGGGGPPGPPAPEPDPAIAVRDGGRLLVMNADGSNQTVLLDTGGDWRNISDPDWSPDGARLVFWSDVQGPGIYTIAADGSDLTRIATTYSVWTPGAPAWSPQPVPGVGGQRHRIAFVDETVPGYNDVFLVDPDGADLLQLTDTPANFENSPTWSPSATRLICGAQGDASEQDLWGLYDFQASTYTVQPHAAVLGGFAGAPAWSKTREDLVAWNSQGDVWIVDLDDISQPIRLTDTADLVEGRASWSPDDSEIVCLTYEDGRRRIRNPGFDVMSAVDGLNRRRIFEGHGGCSWRR